MLRKALLEGPRAILRPLYNSNKAKVSIIKSSHNLIRAYGSGVFGIPKNCQITRFACIFQIFGYAKNTTSVSPNEILRPLNNRYFHHITIVKWSQNWSRTFLKCFFEHIVLFGSFPIVIPIITEKWRSGVRCSWCGSTQVFLDSQWLVEWEKMVTRWHFSETVLLTSPSRC